jgi:hypothetical protein
MASSTRSWFTRHLWQVYLVLALLWAALAVYQGCLLVSGQGSGGTIFALVCALVATAAASYVSVITARNARATR